MITRIKLLTCHITGLTIILMFGCCDPKEPQHTPVLSTVSLSGIRVSTAASGGFITDDGGEIVTSRGVCWSTNPLPAITDSKTTDGTGTGKFISQVTGLSPNTTYYLRAYAVSSLGAGYGTELSFTTFSDTLVDADGNTYSAIQIGDQLWMAENLKTTKFSDYTPVPLVPDPMIWAGLSEPAFCWYNNNDDTCKTIYGALYNWYNIDTAGNGRKNICPDGWHVPSDAEWTALTNFLGGEGVAGGKMKEQGTSHWLSPNHGATDESRFNGLPGGGRFYSGDFSGLGSKGGWWSSTEVDSFPWSARGRYLYYNYSYVYRGYGSKNDGFSIRCVRD